MSGVLSLLVLTALGAGAWRVRPLRRLATTHVLARVHAAAGPMSPARFAQVTLAAAQDEATQTLSGLVIPNVIDIEVHPSDYDSWGPLADEQAGAVVGALAELVAGNDSFALLDAPEVSVLRSETARPHDPRYRFALRRPGGTLGGAPGGHDRRASSMPARIPAPARADDASSQTAQMSANHERPTECSSPAPTRRVLVALPSRPTQPWCAVVALVDGVPLVEKELGKGAHVLGRGERARLRIANDTVSALHCELRVTDDGVSVRDLRSTNGTSVRGVAVGSSAPTSVFDGDEIVLSSEVRVRVIRGAGLRAAA
jgi:hypothetical protein